MTKNQTQKIQKTIKKTVLPPRCPKTLPRSPTTIPRRRLRMRRNQPSNASSSTTGPNRRNLRATLLTRGFIFTNRGLSFPVCFSSATRLYFFLTQIKIIIASEYIKKHNPELLKRSIYGTDPYTSNSDAVCILVHSGIININSFNANKRF